MSPAKYIEGKTKLLKETLLALYHLNIQVTGDNPNLSLREINLWGRRIQRSYDSLEERRPKGRLTTKVAQ
jgi:hypothetical protein